MYKKFQNTVLDWFAENRRDLPWRQTKNPYRILVSEIMLQQTQVPRVTEKYKEFLGEFPTAKKLSEASLPDVLRVWQGLGYNRRGKYLWQAAKDIRGRFGGRFPKNCEDLVSLPGVGDYTAKAVLTFSQNQRHVFVETNIRTVYFYHFFKNKKDVHDKEILELIERTLPKNGEFREWYSALMDYGAYLKSEGLGQNKKSKHYTRQSKFEGSFRQLRANILKLWLEKPRTLTWLYKNIDREKEEIKKALKSLRDEGMI
jgi:A/G-specific adenine glycosylase